jgi:Rho-binding antiterminator
MSQCTISCELHDYLEIACLYGYRVKLTLKDHQIIEGKALDVLTTVEKREYLVIDSGHEQQQIESNQLSKMQVLTANAKFKEVAF